MKQQLETAILSGATKEIKELLKSGNSLSEEELDGILNLARSNGVKLIETLIINRIPQAIDHYSQLEKEELIVGLISELSEKIYASEWNDDIEFELWDWSHSKDMIPEGIRHRVEVEYLMELKKISTTLNLWTIWQNGNHPEAITLMYMSQMKNKKQ